MTLVARTRIKKDGKYISVGASVNKDDFDTQEFADLVLAGAVEDVTAATAAEYDRNLKEQEQLALQAAFDAREAELNQREADLNARSDALQAQIEDLERQKSELDAQIKAAASVKVEAAEPTKTQSTKTEGNK